MKFKPLYTDSQLLKLPELITDLDNLKEGSHAILKEHNPPLLVLIDSIESKSTQKTVKFTTLSLNGIRGSKYQAVFKKSGKEWKLLGKNLI